jgi:hypothetical protein
MHLAQETRSSNWINHGIDLRPFSCARIHSRPETFATFSISDDLQVDQFAKTSTCRSTILRIANAPLFPRVSSFHFIHLQVVGKSQIPAYTPADSLACWLADLLVR